MRRAARRCCPDKGDCVSAERIEAVSREIRQFLRGTFLDAAPVLPISSITGQGFDAFYEALRDMTGQIVPKTTEGVFRLPVEKVFC